MHAGEERKLVTVLFADLVGSTAFAGDRDPERVRVHLERFTTQWVRRSSEPGSAMWSIRLNMQLIEGWAAKALELAADGSETDRLGAGL